MTGFAVNDAHDSALCHSVDFYGYLPAITFQSPHFRVNVITWLLGLKVFTNRHILYFNFFSLGSVINRVL